MAGPALSSHWRPQSTATSSLEPSQVQLRGGTDSFPFTARLCRSGAGKILPPRPALAGLRMVFTFLKGCLKKKKRLCDRDPCMVCTVSTIYYLTLYRKSLHTPVWISVSLYPLKKFAHPPSFFSDTEFVISLLNFFKHGSEMVLLDIKSCCFLFPGIFLSLLGTEQQTPCVITCPLQFIWEERSLASNICWYHMGSE